MARKLPWERHGGSAQSQTQSRPRPSAAHRPSFSPGPSGHARRQASNVNDVNDASDGDGDSSRLPKRARASPPKRSRPNNAVQRFRTPSTSPPPAPPSESFMVDGMAHDDQYRMVEDELLAVAQTFTAHLHAAAYQQLRAKAKSQTAAALRSLARPTTVMTGTSASTDRVARRTAAAKQKATQAAALRAVQDKDGNGDDKDGDDDEAPWTGTALQDLMESDSRKDRPSLVSLASVAGGRGSSGLHTRRPVVAAGKLAVEEDSDDDEDDDLDGPPVRRKTAAPPSTSSSTAPPAPRPRGAETSRIPPARDGPSDKRRTVSFAPRAREIPAKQNEEDDVEEESDGDDDLDDVDAGDLMQKLHKRRAQEKADRLQKNKRRREQKQEQTDKTSMDTIPSFL